MCREWYFLCVKSGNLLIVVSVRKQKTDFLTMTKWVVQFLLPWRLRGVSERLDAGCGWLAALLGFVLLSGLSCF